MCKVFSATRLSALVAVGVVAFAFWPALFGGGSFVASDLVIHHAAPFSAYQPANFAVESGSVDLINIHSHWAPLATDVRSGDVGWWTADLAGGQPTMKGGLPVFNFAYLIAPDWFAPGLVAALRALVAIALTYGFVRSLGLLPVSALVGGIAFAFCGFMVTWMNWPHSSVFALAPGLFWAIERLLRDPKIWRAVPLALVVAAMVWSNFPQVAVYVLLAAAIYVVFRLPTEVRISDGSRARKLATVSLSGVFAVVLAVLLSAPHLIGFAQYLDWADTGYRSWGSFDSSEGIEYLLTAIAPAIWGHGLYGPPWFGEFNWHEPHVYVGFSVLLLALLGWVSGIGRVDRRSRAAIIAMATICAVGVLIAYVGGPLTAPWRHLTGDLFGPMARARVLVHLSVAVAAAFGVERLVAHNRWDSARSIKRSVMLASLLGLALVVAFVPFGATWYDVVVSEGVLRQVLAVSLTPLFAAVAVVVVVLARMRGWLTANAAGWAVVAIVGYEMLSFVTPAHTTVERDERLTATPAHEAVSELLSPGERLSGEGWTFFPSTNALFNIDDARGQVQKSPGYNALIRVEAPEAFSPRAGRNAPPGREFVIEAPDALNPGNGHGTPTWPYIPFDADINSPVWDAMAIGVWAQFPGSRPPGTVLEAAVGVAGSDPARAPLTALLSSPVGGLRAVTVEVVAHARAELEVRITAAEHHSSERRVIVPANSGEQSFAYMGEDLPPGTPVSIEITSLSPAGTLLVAVDESGNVAAGMVAGDDELRLVRSGDVTLIERPKAAFVRLADAAQVEEDPDQAALVVAARLPGEASVVTDVNIGLPIKPSENAELEVRQVSIGRDRVDALVRSDRDALVVISVSDYPGWSAKVNGQVTEIVTADAAFMGVPISEGEHFVSLTFRPRHLTISLLLLALGVALALVLCAVAYCRGEQVFPRTRGINFVGDEQSA